MRESLFLSAISLFLPAYTKKLYKMVGFVINRVLVEMTYWVGDLGVCSPLIQTNPN